MTYKKNFKPGELFNAHKAMAMKKKKKHKTLPRGFSPMTPGALPMNNTKGSRVMKPASFQKGQNVNPLTTAGGKAVGAGYKFKGKKRKGRKPTGAHGRAAVRALGRTKTTGNFAKIEKKSGKGAAIAAYQNALKAHKAGKNKKRK